MPFRTPTFNITYNLWRAYGGTFPIVTPPTMSSQPGQLRITATGSQVAAALAALSFPLLLTPPLTDIRGAITNTPADVVEVPAGTGRYYQVRWVDDRAKGFANEHRVAALRQLVATPGGWRVPTP